MNFYNILLTINPKALLKNQSIRKNIVNSFYYFGGTLIQFVVSIFTQPIFSKYLELQDFAIIGYFAAIQAILFPLFSMTLPFYYLSKYWRFDDGETPQENLSFILNFLNISNGLLAIISYFIINLFFSVLEVKIPLTPFLIIVLTQ
jgi:O-antigen/teichoic acid export membrane protein